MNGGAIRFIFFIFLFIFYFGSDDCSLGNRDSDACYDFQGGRNILLWKALTRKAPKMQFSHPFFVIFAVLGGLCRVRKRMMLQVFV